MARCLIGTSGWVRSHRKDAFYPVGFPASAWFPCYARRLPSLGIINTPHNLPSELPVLNWRALAPEGFIFGVEAGRHTWPEIADRADIISGYLGEGRQVRAYFNNDAGGNAIFDALELRQQVIESG